MSQKKKKKIIFGSTSIILCKYTSITFNDFIYICFDAMHTFSISNLYLILHLLLSLTDSNIVLSIFLSNTASLFASWFIQMTFFWTSSGSKITVEAPLQFESYSRRKFLEIDLMGWWFLKRHRSLDVLDIKMIYILNNQSILEMILALMWPWSSIILKICLYSCKKYYSVDEYMENENHIFMVYVMFRDKFTIWSNQYLYL